MMKLNNFERLLRCNNLGPRKQISSVIRREKIDVQWTKQRHHPAGSIAGDRQSFFGITELTSICFGLFNIFVCFFGKWACQVLFFEPLCEIQILQQLVFGTLCKAWLVVGLVKTWGAVCLICHDVRLRSLVRCHLSSHRWKPSGRTCGHRKKITHWGHVSWKKCHFHQYTASEIWLYNTRDYYYYYEYSSYS